MPRPARAPVVGLTCAVLLVGTALVFPLAFGWDVHAIGLAPLRAGWHPHTGPGTPAALALGVLASLSAVRLAERLPWSMLLATAYVAGFAWMVSLALVDGRRGLGQVLTSRYEYLHAARRVSDVSTLLHGFVARIPLDSPEHWRAHVAGHPPGALLFFVGLIRTGVTTWLAAGLVVVGLAASTAVAVLVVVRLLASQDAARAVAPFVVFGPAAIWQAVSADAMFAAVAAWALAVFAVATRTSRRRTVPWSIAAGLAFGACLMLSYGLVLLVPLVLAVAVPVGRRAVLPTVVAGAATLAVLAGFAFAGFDWWSGLTTLHTRYYAGIAHLRPASYWVWGDLAALTISAGPLLGSGLAELMHRRGPRAIAYIVGGAALAVALADVSLMSKGEVERIWLPFVPWLLVSCAALPRRWRRIGLVVQVVTALVVQHLLLTGW